MNLPDEHWFASAIHERSRIASRDGLHMLDRRESGVSHVKPSEQGLIVMTDDRLHHSSSPLAPETLAWLESTEAPHLPTGTGSLRSIERRAWILAAGVEHRTTRQFFVVPGVGITSPDTAPPQERPGVRLAGTEAMIFRGGSSATLLHELAGHRAETRAAWPGFPEWLQIHDDPALDGVGMAHPDDTGALREKTDLRRGRPSSWRRFRAIDSPQLRMSTLVVAALPGAPWEPPDVRAEIDLIGAGSYDPLMDTVSFSVFAGSWVVNAKRRALQVPQTLVLAAPTLIERIAGAHGLPVPAPGVICGSHGSELPVGSLGCELLIVDGSVA